MLDKQNQFYTSISKYYSEIFPYNPMQLGFVKKCVGNLNDKQILDIGCATGELAFQLSNSGANVVGIDLNEDLLEQAIQNKKHPGLKFQKGNMLELSSSFNQEVFDSVLCFGNTLVHLQSIDFVSSMLAEVFEILKPGGQFLLQILNYNFIVDEQVSTLPVVETENIKFIRKYNFQDNSELIGFETDLEIKAENLIVSNETPLLALRSEKLVELLENAGFGSIELYANFKQEPFGGEHIPLVISCVR